MYSSSETSSFERAHNAFCELRVLVSKVTSSVPSSDFVVRETHPTRPSLTERIPVLGGLGYSEIEAEADRIAADYGLDEARVDRLLFRYGTVLRHVLDLIDGDTLAALWAEATDNVDKA